MNFKDFFRPMKWKLLIALIIFLLWPNYVSEYRVCYDSPLYNAGDGGSNQYGCFNKSMQVSFWYFVLFHLGQPISGGNLLNLVTSLIASYLIGCIIIAAWSKLKPKKN